MNRPAPTLLAIWLQAGGLVLYALACWAIVSMGVLGSAVVWVFTLPGRLLGGKRGNP